MEFCDVTTASERTTDLILERAVSISAQQLWQGWTDPITLMKWFTPAPWVTVEAEIDPVSGGIFRTVMRGPNGEQNEGSGCVLEALEIQRFVWTSALGPGFRPIEASDDGFLFTAIIELEPMAGGTLYRATARHANARDAMEHAEMGFETGWGAALDQLVALFV